MPYVQEREPVTIVDETDDSGPGSFVAAILGLIVVAVIGYMIYAFNHNATAVNPDMNTPSSQNPLSPPQAPTPGPAPAPLSR